jgi:hypothetical protein
MMVAPPFIVLKPGLVVHLVQGPGHWFWLIVSIKKNKKIVNGLQPDFLPGFVGSTGSHRIMTSSIFS